MRAAISARHVGDAAGRCGARRDCGLREWRVHELRRIAPAIAALLLDAVDVLQADAARCGELTGFMRAAALAQAFGRPQPANGMPPPALDRPRLGLVFKDKDAKECAL